MQATACYTLVIRIARSAARFYCRAQKSMLTPISLQEREKVKKREPSDISQHPTNGHRRLTIVGGHRNVMGKRITCPWEVP